MQGGKCEGYLSRKPDKGLIKKWEKFWFETDAFKLSWHKEKGGSAKGAENLRNVSSYTDDTSKDKEGTFLFELKAGKETYHLSADSAEDRLRWLKCIASWAPKEANQLKNVSLTGGATSSAAALGASAGSSSSPAPGAKPTGGVTVPVSANATTVEFPQNNLQEFPSNVLQMKLVETIDFSENKISVIPNEIVNLSATLVVLNLSYNNITTLSPSIGRLNKLEELHLHRNKLTTLPDAIGDLGALQLLSLGENKLTKLPNTIGNLKNLRRLNIAYNVGVQLPNELSQCVQLHWVDISGNRYTKYPDQFLTFKFLEILEANNNEFAMLPANFASIHTNIQQLRLSHNKITALPEDMGKLANLAELEVTFNELRQLPKSLALSHAFLQVDNNPLQYPPQDVASKGSNAIKAFLAQ